MKRLLTILIILFLVFACKKPEDRKCWKSAGSESELELALPDFSKVLLGPHINFVLVQDTVCKAIVRGGKNLLNFITFEMVEDEMHIFNTNKCNFLRSYKKEIEVELHIRDLGELQFEGTKPLKCKNQLVQDYLSLIIRDGAGKVNLDIYCFNLNMIVTHGWGNFDIKGELNYLKVETNGSGFGSTQGVLIHDSLHVVSNSSADIHVGANGVLMRAQTKSLGNIYYKGVPTFLEYNKYGEGELIDEN